MLSAKLTSKGQITIPKAVRDRLKLATGDRVQFLAEADGRIVLAPVTISIRSLKGVLPAPKRAITLKEMDSAIAAGAARHMRRRKA
jgi:antitoxin PrlF